MWMNTSPDPHLGEDEEMALPANTKSTNTTETVRGEHRFVINGYSGKLRAGRVLTSETFAVGGLDWAIRYNPAGAEVGDEVYASVLVRLVTPNASALALYDLRLVDRATGLPSSVRRRRGQPVAFVANKARKRDRGSRWFMPFSELAVSPYLRDDRLTVESVLDDLLGDLASQEHQQLVRDLLVGADRYGMDRLKQICELVLNVGKSLDAETVAAALDPSGQHRHCQALEDGFQFMPST